MPVLPSKSSLIKQLYLPSTSSLPQDQQAWIKIDLSPLGTEDLLLFDELGEGDKKMHAFMEWLTLRIKEWNFTEEDGSPVPISFDTICRLPREDFEYIAQQAAPQQQDSPNLSADQKKS
jgi:hypothetical protein